MLNCSLGGTKSNKFMLTIINWPQEKNVSISSQFSSVIVFQGKNAIFYQIKVFKKQPYYC